MSTTLQIKLFSAPPSRSERRKRPKGLRRGQFVKTSRQPSWLLIAESVLAKGGQHAWFGLTVCRGSGKLLTSASSQGEKTAASQHQPRQPCSNDRARNHEAYERVRAIIRHLTCGRWGRRTTK